MAPDASVRAANNPQSQPPQKRISEMSEELVWIGTNHRAAHTSDEEEEEEERKGPQ